MKRRLTLLFLIMVTMAFLVGWGKKSVELLDSTKLIDLREAIGLAKPGGSKGESDNESAQSDEEVSVNEALEDKSMDDTVESIEVPRNIVIRIRNEEITYTYGSTVMNISVAELEKQLRNNFSVETSITLIDDFAEAHIYREVQGILNNLKSELGLTYKLDSFPEGE